MQGSEPLDRTYAGFDDIGEAMTVWNRDASATGGHGLIALNQAAEAPADRSKVAALIAIAADCVPADFTGAYGAIIRWVATTRSPAPRPRTHTCLLLFKGWYARVGAVSTEQLGQTLESTDVAPAMGRLISAPEDDGLAWVMLSGQ